MKKHKRIIAGVMAVCLMGSVGVISESIAPAVSITASAEEEYTYENLTYTFLEDGTIEITHCDKSVKKVIIPDKIDGTTVTSIGGSAFSFCQSLTEITIPDSVTSIGKSAFCCANLTSINVSKNNKYYSDKDGVLFNKDKTELVVYPSGKDSTEYIIPDSVIKIGACAFYGCSNLTEIILPDRVTSIGYSAFADCKNLSSIKIPDSVTTVGVNTFLFCNSLKSIKLSSNLERISHEMFYGCSSLESIYIPDSVTEIGYRAFTSCINLKEIHIPSSVEKIYCDCFSYCESLKEISLPDSITEWHIFADSEYYGEGGIGTTFGQFFGCSSLESVKISAGLNKINYQDFGNCFALKSIVIPENIESIGNYAFCNSQSIEKITFLNPDCNISSEAAITHECVICGYENSTAQAYAEKYGYKFESLGKTPEENTATGDLNGDNEFNVSDLVLLQKYLFGADDTEISDWKQADLNDDGVLDIFDLCLMRKKLIEK